jgi:hypothetical protein
MASHDFQTALHNYLDLEDLRSKLMGWQTSLDAFDDLIRLRGDNYTPLLPQVDAQFQELDSQDAPASGAARRTWASACARCSPAPRPEYLATAEERIAGERLAAMEKQLPPSDPLRERVARLRGTLTWRLESEYHTRLTAAYEHQCTMEADVADMTEQYDAFVRSRQAATHSYVGYDAPDLAPAPAA